MCFQLCEPADRPNSHINQDPTVASKACSQLEPIGEDPKTGLTPIPLSQKTTLADASAGSSQISRPSNSSERKKTNSTVAPQ